MPVTEDGGAGSAGRFDEREAPLLLTRAQSNPSEERARADTHPVLNNSTKQQNPNNPNNPNQATSSGT